MICTRMVSVGLTIEEPSGFAEASWLTILIELCLGNGCSFANCEYRSYNLELVGGCYQLRETQGSKDRRSSLGQQDDK